MGIDTFNFADALLGICCPTPRKKALRQLQANRRSTREKYEELIAAFVHYSAKVSDLIPPYEDAALWVRNGCENCMGSGYRGHIAIHELMLGHIAPRHARYAVATLQES